MAKKVKEVTASEAITKLTMFFREFVMIGAPDGSLGAAIRSLEKQVPMKVLGLETNLWHCPKCNANVDIQENYCPNCGQALDWNEQATEIVKGYTDQEQSKNNF